jgi:hypothetical protein
VVDSEGSENSKILIYLAQAESQQEAQFLRQYGEQIANETIPGSRRVTIIRITLRSGHKIDELSL